MFATQIALSILTNLFCQRFEKHSMLESTLDILQQFYIQVEKQSDEYHLFVGDLATYMLWCKRCGQCVTHHGSIGDTLFHAPAAMLFHWNMIEPNTSNRRSESLSLNNGLNICEYLCVYVCVSVPLQYLGSVVYCHAG